MVKMNGFAAIDSVRPFRFWIDKAAVAADFHLGNGTCYLGICRIASTASVCTLAENGACHTGVTCCLASTSGVATHRKNGAPGCLPKRHFSILGVSQTLYF